MIAGVETLAETKRSDRVVWPAFYLNGSKGDPAQLNTLGACAYDLNFLDSQHRETRLLGSSVPTGSQVLGAARTAIEENWKYAASRGQSRDEIQWVLRVKTYGGIN